MGKIKVGIIGCGGIANGKHMPGLSKVSDCEMVAFCDIIVEKAEEACEKYGTEDAKVYEDYKELLKDESIEVIHVCTPNRSHSFITIDALEAGKHVMCEKPMAINSKEAKDMVLASRRTGKKLTIGYQTRQQANSQHLKKVVQNGELGEIYYAKAHAIRRRAVPTWGVFLKAEEQGGGPLIDIGTHALDITLWEMDNYRPKSVTGSVYRKLADQESPANIWGAWDKNEFTVEDSAFGFIKMENGATIVLESSWALNSLDVREARTTLCGTQGGADMEDELRINGEEHGRLFVKKPDFSSGSVAYFEGDAITSPADLEAYQWIQAVKNDTDPTVLPEQAYVVSLILEAIYKSAETGETIELNADI